MRVPRLVNAGWHRSDGPARSERARRGWSAVAFGAIGILVWILVGAGPAAAASIGTLRVDPAFGRPTTKFTVTYEYAPATTACVKGSVTFKWDGTDLRTVAVGQVMVSRTVRCRAVLGNALPPADDRDPGPHTISVDTHGLPPADARPYTILPGPTQSARPSPTPSRTSASPTRRPTADPTDDTVAGGIDTSPASLAPLGTGQPSVAGVASGGGSGGGGLMSWVLIFGGLLVLGGITIFGLLIYWTRRGGPGEVEPDTQVFGE